MFCIQKRSKTVKTRCLSQKADSATDHTGPLHKPCLLGYNRKGGCISSPQPHTWLGTEVTYPDTQLISRWAERQT